MISWAEHFARLDDDAKAKNGSCLEFFAFRSFRRVGFWRALLSLSKLPTASAHDPTETIGSRQDAAQSGISTPIPRLEWVRTVDLGFVAPNGSFAANAGASLDVIFITDASCLSLIRRAAGHSCASNVFPDANWRS
ncbi:hypothetical protein CWR43_30420 [Rhizobium sullae]|uniref:Uncharacterized protein n=1 Tax=Rhizobium sullae TaxID=50338 RepID=A0A2N0D0L3_RHISU|nr:hypothetical protein CWR43_30420 [Rhizobium sullae]